MLKISICHAVRILDGIQIQIAVSVVCRIIRTHHRKRIQLAQSIAQSGSLIGILAHVIFPAALISRQRDKLVFAVLCIFWFAGILLACQQRLQRSYPFIQLVPCGSLLRHFIAKQQLPDLVNHFFQRLFVVIGHRLKNRIQCFERFRKIGLV